MMERIVCKILVGIFGLFLASKELLLSRFEILNNSESCRCENNLVIGLSEMESIFVSVPGKAVDMVDFVGDIWLGSIVDCIWWRLLENLFQEELRFVLLLL